MSAAKSKPARGRSESPVRNAKTKDRERDEKPDDHTDCGIGDQKGPDTACSCTDTNKQTHCASHGCVFCKAAPDQKTLEKQRDEFLVGPEVTANRTLIDAYIEKHSKYPKQYKRLQTAKEEWHNRVVLWALSRTDHHAELQKKLAEWDKKTPLKIQQLRAKWVENGKKHKDPQAHAESVVELQREEFEKKHAFKTPCPVFKMRTISEDELTEEKTKFPKRGWRSLPTEVEVPFKFMKQDKAVLPDFPDFKAMAGPEAIVEFLKVCERRFDMLSDCTFGDISNVPDELHDECLTATGLDTGLVTKGAEEEEDGEGEDEEDEEGEEDK